MTRCMGPWLAALLTASTAVTAAAQPPSLPEGEPRIAVQSSLDRPAVWVADRLTYTIEIACPPGLDILVEDLAGEKLKLTGLDLIGSDSARRVDPNGVTRYVFHYVLTTYRVDVAAPAIGPLTVRTYRARPGQAPANAAADGAVLVPGAVAAFRSLLPDDQPIYEVRDAPPVSPRWLPFRLLASAGIGLMLLSAVPVALLAIRLAGMARARRQRAPRPSARQIRRATRAALDEIAAADAAVPEVRREAFARLDALVRQHVTEVCGVAVIGMTPDEIAAAIAPSAARLPSAHVTSVLAACELARYATPELLPSADAWQEAVASAGNLLSASR